MKTNLELFTDAYIECALWASTDDDGDPLDGTYDDGDFSEETLKQIKEDCKDFWDAWGNEILHATDDPPRRDAERAGQDFWLTRNGHGANFLDGHWPKELAQRLYEMTKPYGEFNLYVGDDGKLYHHG